LKLALHIITGTYLNSKSNPNDANRSGGSLMEDTAPTNVVDPWVCIFKMFYMYVVIGIVD
jgi:hypothetical protein